MFVFSCFCKDSGRKVLDLPCNFRTSVLLVLAQTVEQKYSLLNTRDVITFSRVLESRRYLILLISHKQAIQADMISVTCSFGQEFIARQDPQWKQLEQFPFPVV